MKATTELSRRDAIKGGAAVTVASIPMLSVTVQGATDSGNVELDSDATIPASTSVSVRIIEDESGNGTADRQQEMEIEDGTNTYVFDVLAGFEGQAYNYWMDISLSGDGTETPEVHGLTVTLPEEEPDLDEEIEVWEDDFEDGNIDGWSGENIAISNQSTIASHSLEALDGVSSAEAFPNWDDGPRLDLQEEFTAEGVSYVNQGDGNGRSGFGLITDAGDGAILIFSGQFGVTFLATNGTESFDGQTHDSYNSAFNHEWVNWEMYSAGDGTVEAKVWSVGDSEPSSYQLSRTFDTPGSNFRIWSGTSNRGREVYMDQLTITGQVFVPEEHEDIRFNARHFVVLDESIPYDIEYNDPDEGWTDITDSVDSLRVEDQNVVELDETAHTISGVGKGETFIEIEHADIIAGHEISSATVTITDLEYLPGFRRVQAIVGDRGFQAIGIATIGAAVISGFTRSGWAGVALGAMILIVAWAAGGAPAGIAISAVLFIVLAAMLRLEMQT